jgi:hypothetical protein
MREEKTIRLPDCPVCGGERPCGCENDLKEKIEWEGFYAGEDIYCGDYICRKGNLFFRCRTNGKYPKEKPPKIEEWEKRFKDKFYQEWQKFYDKLFIDGKIIRYVYGDGDKMRENLQDFLAQQNHQYRQEILEEIVLYNSLALKLAFLNLLLEQDKPNQIYNQALQEIKELINKDYE